MWQGNCGRKGASTGRGAPLGYTSAHDRYPTDPGKSTEVVLVLAVLGADACDRVHNGRRTSRDGRGMTTPVRAQTSESLPRRPDTAREAGSRGESAGSGRPARPHAYKYGRRTVPAATDAELRPCVCAGVVAASAGAGGPEPHGAHVTPWLCACHCRYGTLRPQPDSKGVGSSLTGQAPLHSMRWVARKWRQRRNCVRCSCLY